MGNLVTLVKYSDFPFTTGLIIRRLANMAQTTNANPPPTQSSIAPQVITSPASSSSSSSSVVSIDGRDSLQRTALHWACLRSNEVLVKLLVGFDADLNAVDVFGFTPFHYAVWRVEDERLLEYLVRHGAALNAWTSTPTTMATAMAPTAAPLLSPCVVDCSRSPTAPVAPNFLNLRALHVAAGAGNIAGINFCLRCGLDVNLPASNGGTPIHFATAWCRDGAVFERLAEAGANLRAVDARGRNLVHLAGIFKNEIALDFAIVRNLKIDEMDSKGKRALDYAMTRYSCETSSLPHSPQLDSTHLANVKRVQDKLLLYTRIALNVNGNSANLFLAASSASTSALASTSATAPPVAPSAPSSVDEDALTCMICMESPKDTAFGCGHLCCHDCAAKISLCHLCKRRITERKRIFLN